MGNFVSTNNATKKFDHFYHVMDYIATYYILTMDFKSLTKLSEKEYCDELVVLTSDIIKRYFTDMEIEYLAQRVKNGVEVNEMEMDNVIFLNKTQLDSLDVSNDAQKNIRKKRVCNGIAKFYVKIAHIFSAIIMTINPVYTYKGPNGETIKTPFMEKGSIPRNVPRSLYKLNICDNRINALKKNEKYDKETKKVTLQPKICDMNLDTTTQQPKNLSEEPGIAELMRLYLDDNYDYSTGVFTGMSDKTRQQYNQDLKSFYTAFTGKETMPDSIKQFSDIKLKDYSKLKGCQAENPIFKKSYTVEQDDELFANYAQNTRQMIQNAANNQIKLMSVINSLFTYVIDPYSNKKRIRINPLLNDALLQDCVVKTRKLIVNLYITCEKDYVNGLKLYEAIVHSKILSTTSNQIATLKSESNNILNSVSKLDAPAKLPNQDIPAEEDSKFKLKPEYESNPMSTNLSTTNLEPEPFSTPMSTTNLEPKPFSTPLSTANLEPKPVSSPLSTPNLEPKPFSTPMSTPNLEPKLFSSPLSTANLEPKPFSTPLLTANLEPKPFSSPLSTANLEPKPFSSPLSTANLEPKPFSSPLSTPNLEPKPFSTANLEPSPILPISTPNLNLEQNQFQHQIHF